METIGISKILVQFPLYFYPLHAGNHFAHLHGSLGAGTPKIQNSKCYFLYLCPVHAGTFSVRHAAAGSDYGENSVSQSCRTDFHVSGFGSSLSIIMYHGFIKNVPLELEEAATIDGANAFQVFWRIVFPLLKSITVTIAILNLMWIWNDFLLPQLVINKPGWQTIPLKTFYFFGQYSKRWDLATAGLLLGMIPIIVFYIFAQKYIVKGVTDGAIK